MVDTLMRLPASIEKGTQGGDEFRTNIPEPAESGHEQRTITWDQCRYRGEVGFSIRPLRDGGGDDLEKIITHHKRCKGRALSFPFPDPSDHEAVTPQLIGVGNGSTVTYQLVRNYIFDQNLDGVDDESHGYTRIITLPISGTVKIYLDDVLKTETTDYTIDYRTGLITFLHGLPTAGQSITATFQFCKACRWDADQLKVSMIMIDLGQIPSMPIVEVIGE